MTTRTLNLKRLVATAALLALALGVFGGCRAKTAELSRDALLEGARQGRVETVTIDKKGLVGRVADKGGKVRSFRTAASPEEAEKLAQELSGLRVHIVRPLPFWARGAALALWWVLVGLWGRNVRHFFRSALAGVFYLALLWWWHTLTPMPQDVLGFFNLGALRYKFFLSGPIPPAILWTLLASFHYIYQVFKFELLPLKMAKLQHQAALTALERKEEKALKLLLKQRDGGFVTERLARLERRFARDGDLAAVIALKNDLLEKDEERFSLAFTAVRWSEMALPLLGFLGTVVGIGEAMAGVSQGIGLLFQGEPMAAVLPDLNKGFSGMAVAFDTTFLGLGGLILVGVLHMALRKGLAANLAEARNALTQAVESWTGSSGQRQVVVSLSGIRDRLLSSESHLRRLEEAVRNSDQRASLFRETARLMVTRVIREDPQFKSIRKVLLNPVVEFQEAGRDLTAKTEEFLTEKLGNGWTLAAFGLSLEPAREGTLVAQAGDGGVWLLPISLHGPKSGTLYKASEGIRRLLCLDGKQTLTLSLDKSAADGGAPAGRLVALRSESELAVPTFQQQAVSPADELHPVVVDGGGSVLWLRHLPHGRGVEALLWSGSAPVAAGRLPDGWRWEWTATHGPSASLFAVGTSRSGGPPRLLAARLEGRPEPKRDGDGGTASVSPKVPIVLAGEDRYVDLPTDLAPRQLVSLSPETVVILDREGALHYWDVSRSEPRRLSHRDWRNAADTLLREGRHGWLAVAQGGKLSMWQVHRGGWLEHYEGAEFDISGLLVESLCASFDGALLYGISQRGVFAWEFPKLAIDEF